MTKPLTCPSQTFSWKKLWNATATVPILQGKETQDPSQKSTTKEKPNSKNRDEFQRVQIAQWHNASEKRERKPSPRKYNENKIKELWWIPKEFQITQWNKITNEGKREIENPNQGIAMRKNHGLWWIPSSWNDLTKQYYKWEEKQETKSTRKGRGSRAVINSRVLIVWYNTSEIRNRKLRSRTYNEEKTKY